MRSISADGSIGVAGPWGIATGTPSGSISDADTRINSIKFANSFQKAVDRFQYTCSGPDPSKTGMGLANWFEGSVRAIDKESLVSLSFTKQFNIVAAAGARFGYTLLPVTNPVTASAGMGGSSGLHKSFHNCPYSACPSTQASERARNELPRSEAIDDPGRLSWRGSNHAKACARSTRIAQAAGLAGPRT